jgi:prevent-host-death family protein
MKFVTVSQLRADAPRIIGELEKTGEEVVITKKGKPVAILRRATEDMFQLKPDETGPERRNYGSERDLPEG